MELVIIYIFIFDSLGQAIVDSFTMNVQKGDRLYNSCTIQIIVQA